MNVIDVVFTVGWLVFWIGWLVAAAQTRSARNPGAGTGGTFGGGPGRGVLIRLVLGPIVYGLIRGGVLRNRADVHSAWLQGLGLALFAAGLGLAVWARLYIGNNWGTPMSQKADPELVTSGPYARIRHPIYSGIILAMIGSALALNVYWLIAVAIPAAYFIFSATREERYLAGRFPDSYPQYKRSTKMLIPFLF